MSRPRKISVVIDSHPTSLSLEPEFWDAFVDLCKKDGTRLADGLAAIDHERDGGLSGAVRLWVLKRLRDQAR
jgi:predicted DNA-binding ribbon-helix-helix protein